MEQSQPPSWKTYRNTGIGLIITGLLFAGFSVWNYNYIAGLEARNIPLYEVGFFAWLYDLGGKTLSAGFIALVGVMAIGFGISTLRNGLRQRKASPSTRDS